MNTQGITISPKLEPWAVLVSFFLLSTLVVCIMNAIEQAFNVRYLYDDVVLGCVMLVLVLFYLFYYKKQFPDLFRMFRFSAAQLSCGALTTGLVFLCSVIAIQLLIQGNVTSFHSSRLSWGFLNMLVPILIAPIIEEIFFRGILLRVFLAHYSVPSALIFSGLAFAVIHLAPMPGESRIELVSFFFAQWCEGLLLCAITYKTKNLSYAFGFHVANNLLVFLAG